MKVPLTQQCAKCDSKKLVFTSGKDNPKFGTHAGRLTCGDCGSYISWVSKDLSRFLSRFVFAIDSDKKGE